MNRKIRTGVFTCLGMFVLILDTKTAIAGAQDAVNICLMTVIPSLFPFFVLSILLTDALTGWQSPLLKPLGRLCRIPAGSESILILGLLGGYPTGAQSVAQAHRAGQLSKTDAHRMLGFCNNAGPAFLFGMIAPAFPNSQCAWILWLIHIISCLLTGVILPGGSHNTAIITGSEKGISVTQAVESAIRVMGKVCSWIFLFRIILAFLERWFLWLLPTPARATVAGLLELSNGCIMLNDVSLPGLRFLLCAAMLGFGGLCVTMQTQSVTDSLGMYFPGKLLQTVISIILAVLTQPLLFPPAEQTVVSPAIMIGCILLTAIVILILQKRENRSRFPVKIGV